MFTEDRWLLNRGRCLGKMDTLRQNLLISNGVVGLLQDPFSNRIYYILFLFPVECVILISASVPIAVLHFYIQD